MKPEVSVDQDSVRRADKHQRLVEKCRARITRTLGNDLPELGLVLGSGFQEVLRGFRVVSEVSYRQLPGFPPAGVPGHAGKLLLAELDGLRWLVCSGRAHFYEGHEMETVMFPVRMLSMCGVKELVLTNAAGGINPKFRPGDFMLVTDHINFTGVNPLRGLTFAATSPFVDLTHAYCPKLRQELAGSARHARLPMHSGVYLAVAGPSFETPAEIRAFRKLGADAVGMSTVPEVLMARALGVRVAALSCITNPAAGMRRRELSHREVLETGARSAGQALRLLSAFSRQRAKNERSRPRKNLKKSSAPVGSNLVER